MQSDMSPWGCSTADAIGTTILEINRKQKTLRKRDGSNNQSRSQGWRVTKYDIFHCKICYIKTKQRGPDGACHGLRAACCHFSSQTRKGLKWVALHFASCSELLSNPFQNLGYGAEKSKHTPMKLWAQFIVGRSPSLDHKVEKFIELMASIVNPSPPVSQLSWKFFCMWTSDISLRVCLALILLVTVFLQCMLLILLAPSLSFAWETQNHYLVRVL